MISFTVETSPMKFEPLYDNDYFLRIDNFPCYRGEFFVHFTQGETTFVKRFFVTYCEEFPNLYPRKHYFYHGYFAIRLPRLHFPEISKQEERLLKKRIREALVRKLDALEKEIKEDIAKATTIVSKIAIYEREQGNYYVRTYLKGYKNTLSIDVSVSNGYFYMFQFKEMTSTYTGRDFRGKSYYYHEEIFQQIVDILKSHPKFRVRLLTAREKNYLLPSYEEKTFNIIKTKVVILARGD